MWQETLVQMVRTLIGDFSDTPRYENSRIEQAILTAALIVNQQYSFDVEYILDFSGVSITPDPTEPDSMDNAAVALIALKAACLLSLNDYQKAVGAGIRVRDGDSEVDTTGRFKGYSDIINIGPCASYEKLLRDLSTKRGMNTGGAVLSPYGWGGATWGNRDHNGTWHIRSFFDNWHLW